MLQERNTSVSGWRSQFPRRFVLAALGVVTFLGMESFDVFEHCLVPGMAHRSSDAVTFAFLSVIAVALGFVLQRRQERSRHKLSAESKERQRAEEESRTQTLARKEAEDRLRQSEERMTMAIDAARIGFFDWDCIRDEQVWSATARRLLGIAPDCLADLGVLIDAVHPDDREPLQQSITGITPLNPEFALEHRACWRDGTVHWIWAKGRGFFDNDRLLRISGIAMDIDERKQAEQQYRLHAAALEEAANGVVLTDQAGNILWVNPAFTQMTGYTSEEAIGQNPRILRSGQHNAAFYQAMWKTILAGEVWRGEMVNRKKDGSLYTEEMTVAPVRSQGGAISHFVAIKQDITERKRAVEALQAAERRYRSIFENAVLGIFQSLPDGRFLDVNPALVKMAGYDSVEEFLREVPSVLGLYVDLNHRKELVSRLSSQKVVTEFELALRARDGRTCMALINMHSVTDPSGAVLYNEGTVQDITERKLAEDQVRFLAYHDALTSLPNRTLFEDRLEKALANARRRGQRVAVLWLDIDNFKNINDSLGHSIGDLVLKQVGERLRKCAREQDSVARAGGDEFVLLLTDLERSSPAQVTADRIRNAMSGEYLLRGHVLNVTCSVGISVFPDHGADSETLIRNADAAMYSAKENGRNSVRFFTRDLAVLATERLELESRLCVALEKRELFLVYQPEVQLCTGRIIGAEALLRWSNPELGLISPDRFIPVAENSGSIIPIGEWVLETACAQARHWQELGLLALPIAVNVSAVQLRQGRFLQVVRRVLDETGLAPQFLELEITEGVLLSNAEATLSMLRELAGMGLRLSIDDFGTGYSSLSYLKDLPVCKLKIDRSFVQTITTNPRNAAITATVINMGKSLDLKVLAEGVATEEQLCFLRAHGCDEGQGYYFSKPLPVDELASLLRGAPFLPPILPSQIPIAPSPYGLEYSGEASAQRTN